MKTIVAFVLGAVMVGISSGAMACWYEPGHKYGWIDQEAYLEMNGYWH